MDKRIVVSSAAERTYLARSRSQSHEASGQGNYQRYAVTFGLGLKCAAAVGASRISGGIRWEQGPVYYGHAHEVRMGKSSRVFLGRSQGHLWQSNHLGFRRGFPHRRETNRNRES